LRIADIGAAKAINSINATTINVEKITLP